MVTKHFAKFPPEIRIAQRIEERIESGVEVPHPRGGGENPRVHTVITKRYDHEQDEVGQEAQRERPHDHPQLSGRFDLLRQRRRLSEMLDPVLDVEHAREASVLVVPQNEHVLLLAGAPFRHRHRLVEQQFGLSYLAYAADDGVVVAGGAAGPLAAVLARFVLERAGRRAGVIGKRRVAPHVVVGDHREGVRPPQGQPLLVEVPLDPLRLRVDDALVVNVLHPVLNRSLAALPRAHLAFHCDQSQVLVAVFWFRGHASPEMVAPLRDAVSGRRGRGVVVLSSRPGVGGRAVSREVLHAVVLCASVAMDRVV